MSMFELNPTNQMRNLIQRTKRSRPVGNGQAGIIAGHQGTGDDEHKRNARRKDGEAVMGLVVRYGNDLQKRLLGGSV